MKNLLFLSGLPRSGSTLLGSILSQHPEIYVTPTSPLSDLLCLIDESFSRLDIQYTYDKQNIVRLAESAEQLDAALDYIRENPRVKLMGLSTKGNLIFKEGINEVKITRSGRMI